MEKLLAMSILSSGPSDLSGFNGWFAWSQRNTRRREEEESNVKECSIQPQAREKKLGYKMQTSPRFALELDGLHCFETIISN